MAVGMQQDPVLSAIRTTMRPPHQVMAMPARQLGDALVADHTPSVLLLPQAKEIPATLEVVSPVLPMGVRETRFSMAYCHPYMNPMTEPDDMEGHHEG